MFERKARTIDKNTLQRRVEDLITKISAVGIKTFRSSKPELLPLFENLIPPSGGSSDPESKKTNGKPQPAAATA